MPFQRRDKPLGSGLPGKADFGLADLTDNDLIQWNSTTGRWENVTAASLGASIDHGSVAGLADDDHTQYLLVDGTRALTDNLLFSDATNPIIDLTTDSATLTLRGRSSASANRTLATFDPDEGLTGYYQGAEAFRSATQGLDVLTSATASQPRITFYDTNGTTSKGILQHGNTVYLWRGDVDSAVFRLSGNNASSAATTIFEGDPDGGITGYYQGLAVFRTNDGSASDKVSYADVKDFDGSYRDVGFAVHTLTDFNTNLTLTQTHYAGKVLRDTETTTPRILYLVNNSAIPFGAEVEVWNGQTGTSGTNLTIAQGSGVTLRWYDGSGTISTGNRTLAVSGYCKIRKYNDTIYWITGVGIT